MSNGKTDTPDFIPAQDTPDFIPDDTPLPKKKPSLYDKATTPLVSGKTILKGTAYESEKAKSEKAIKEGGQPFKAGMYAFGAGVDKSMSDLVSSFSSPASIGLMAASGGESALGKGALKTLLRAIGVGGAGMFGVKGAQEAKKTDPMDYLRAIGYSTGLTKTPPKASPDQMESSLFGASATAGALAGTGAMSRDAVHTVLRRAMKLDDDLASKVSDRVVKAQQARAQEATSKAAHKAVGKTLEEMKMKAGGELLADTTQALVQEQARVQKPFHEIAGKITEPIASGESVRSIVSDAVKNAGGKPEEIPPAAFKAMPPESESGPGMITIQGKSVPIASLSPALQKSLGVKAGPVADITFSDLTRIREDLGSAAQAAKDSAVKTGLFEAQKKITDIQEKAAEAKGLGDKYRAAKADYTKFKRGIGSDLINNWLSAYDVEDQAIGPKVQKLFSKSTAEALRNVLKSAGLDVSPIDSIVERMKELKTQSKTAATEQRKSVAQAESTKDIIPGTKAADWAGQSNDDIVRARLAHQANSLREAGVREPFALMQYAIGLFQLARGSAFGMYHVARAGAMTLIPERIKSPEFQNWLMDKAGIEDRTLTKKISDGLYKAVRKAMQSGVQEQATATQGARKRESTSPVP